MIYGCSVPDTNNDFLSSPGGNPTSFVAHGWPSVTGRYGLFLANPYKYLVRTGSDITEDIIVGTGPSIGGGDAQQVIYIKVEGDYLDTVTYDSVPHAWTFS